MTLGQMEKCKKQMEQEQIGLGHMDKEIVNFIMDEEETGELKFREQQLFDNNMPKKGKSNKHNPYDFFFNAKNYQGGANADVLA